MTKTEAQGVLTALMAAAEGIQAQAQGLHDLLGAEDRDPRAAEVLMIEGAQMALGLEVTE